MTTARRLASLWALGALLVAPGRARADAGRGVPAAEEDAAEEEAEEAPAEEEY